MCIAGGAAPAAPQTLTADITVNNAFASAQTVLAYDVSGTITPEPQPIAGMITTTFVAQQANATEMKGNIAYNRCHFHWHIVKTGEQAYQISATADEKKTCSAESVADPKTGRLAVTFTIAP